jgi:hypothetical protein
MELKQYKHCNSTKIQLYNSQGNTAPVVPDIIRDADEYLSASTTISIWISVCDYYSTMASASYSNVNPSIKT